MAWSRKNEEKLLSCPVCSETLQSPRILPCLHTFCEKCIHEIILSMKSQKETKLTKFSYPVCRTKVKPTKGTDEENWASLLPKNVTVSTIMAAANGVKQECHACERHEQKSDAMFWCKECEEALCEKCNTVHSKLKVTSTHSVFPVDNIASNTSGIDISGIREECTIHPSRKLEAYCSEHDTLCCLLCVTLKHKNCNIVTVLNEDSESEANPQHDLPVIKNAIDNLLKKKEQKLNDFNKNVENIEDEAARFKESVKCKLDELFQTFTKQLHIFRDEQNAKINLQIRLLKQLVNSVQHWTDTTKVVQDNGTQIQLFVHMETVKQQIKTCVDELSQSCTDDQRISVEFSKNEIVDQVTELDQIGKYKINKEKLFGQMSDIYVSCRNLKIRYWPVFENISVMKIGRFHFPGSNIACGWSINKETLFLGDASTPKKLHLFSTKTESVIYTRVFDGYVKRVCYDKRHKQVFISCYSKELYKASLSEEIQIEKPLVMKPNKYYVGSLCSHEESVYVVVPGGIKSFSATADCLDAMFLCFETNTVNESNGMHMAMYNSTIFYTTRDKEIKCAKLNGEEVFCYKHVEIRTPASLVVLPSGLIFVLDVSNHGLLHVLATDGSGHRTLLSKLDDIKDPLYMWLDNDSETMYIAGGEYIEQYRITSE